jgi:membrane protein
MDFIVDPIERRLWPDEPQATPPVWIKAARYFYALARDYLRGDLSLRAMSLVYTTMLLIVPLLALSFATAIGFGLHHSMRDLLLRVVAPVGGRAAELVDELIAFIDAASTQALVIVGIPLLVLSALSMAQKVELSFNYVWRVDRPRSFARRFAEYLSVIFLGPLMMAAAFAFLSSTESLESMRFIGPVVATVGDLMPTMIMVCAFTFLYVFVPNTRVYFKPALIGGTVAGVLWVASGRLFTIFVTNSARTAAIYAGFAIVIFTMLWLYLSWLVLLLGAQLAFYVQNPEYLRLGQRAEYLSNGLRERLALGTMLLIGADFEKPGHGWRTEGLASRIRVPRHHLEPVLAALTDAGLVTETAEHRLLPGRDLRRIAIADILMAVRNPGGKPRGTPSADWNPTVRGLTERIERGINDALEGHTLADLVDEDAQRTASEPQPEMSAPKKPGRSAFTVRRP